MKRLCLSLSLLIPSLVFSVDRIRDLTILSHNNEFIITLPSNPTTGFQLNIKSYDKTQLKLLNMHFISSQSNLIGSGGQMQFRFKRLSTQNSTTTIMFQYARPWEPKTAMTDRVVVHFK